MLTAPDDASVIVVAVVELIAAPRVVSPAMVGQEVNAMLRWSFLC
jgi:hypothetical protein